MCLFPYLLWTTTITCDLYLIWSYPFNDHTHFVLWEHIIPFLHFLPFHAIKVVLRELVDVDDLIPDEGEVQAAA